MFIGAIVIVLSGVVLYGASSNIAHAIEEGRSQLADTYRLIYFAGMIQTFGYSLAFIGIAVAFAGTVLQPDPPQPPT